MSLKRSLTMYATVLKNIVKLPNWINLSLLALNRNPYLIYGNNYRNYCDFLKNSVKHYSNTHLLIKTVNKAINEVPYYKKQYGNIKITSIEEFESIIEFINKDTILQNFNSFINPLINQNDYDHGTTGGTGGKPLKLIVPKNRYIVEMATMHSLWGHAGFDFSVRAVIRNHKLSNSIDYIVNPITKEIIFDGFRLDQDYFDFIFRARKKSFDE